MSPTAGGSEPFRSASSVVADTAWGCHIFKIDGYSHTLGTPTGECLESHPFTLGGHRWRIRYYPNGRWPEDKDYISFFLALDDAVAKAVKARLQFRFVGEVVVEKPMALGAVQSFEAASCRWGFTRFITRADLEKSKHLKDDSFSIRCDVVVIHELRTMVDTAQSAPPVFVSVPPSNLGWQLGDLLLTEKDADVVFEVGGETFPAHRCVLAARSPVFSAELFSKMKEGETASIIRIEDMEVQVFRALLYFVYTDSLPTTKKREQEADVMAQHLLVAADRYNLPRLKSMCEEKLCRYIDVGTVATILTLAEQHHCLGLKKAWLHFLNSLADLGAVVSSDGFKHLSRSCPSVMEELVAMLGSRKRRFSAIEKC